MRKLSTILMSFFCCLSVVAGEISEEQALQKAQKFMEGKLLKKQVALSRSTSKHTPKQGEAPSYYVFNAEDDGGFVVIAGNDQMPEVLGYANNGSLNLDEAPDNVRWIFNYYAEVAKALDGGTKVQGYGSTRGLPEVQPLITTTWDQGTPYNAHCPDFNGQLAPTGCVATAMAQVINYFQWPINEVRSVASYTTETRERSLPELPARKFQWFSMTDDEIAWLMRYCGQSVQMNYNPEESGANAMDIRNALVLVFDYSRTSRFVNRNDFSDSNWEELMYNELSLGRPVIYNGDSGPYTEGHSFILHGYKDGLFYVNWGWSGNCDGYFALTNLSPNTEQHYTENHYAIVGIQPSSNNDDNVEETAGEITVHLDKAGTLSSHISQDEKFNIKKLTLSGNVNGTDFQLIREMFQLNNGGKLESLDLSKARIVSDGIITTQDDCVTNNLFKDCRRLLFLTLPPNVTTIESEAFMNTSLRSFVIPKSVTSIGTGVFRGCWGLASIEVEAGNPNYYSPAGSNALVERSTQKLIAGCSGTVIPEGVTTIASCAFSGTNVVALKFPESLTTIEENAFEDTRLVSVHIPKNVTSIAKGVFEPTEIKTITVDPQNKVYDSRNNCHCLIETATNTLILGSISSVIPEGIVTIGKKAFQHVPVYSIKLPQSLERIEDHAFYDCLYLWVEIPEGVKEIGEGGLTAYYLKTIKSKAQTPPTLSNSLDFMYRNLKLIVPDGTKEKYKAAPGWSTIETILEESETHPTLTVNVMPAGSLSTLITEKQCAETEELVVTGEMNDEDFKFIQDNMSSENLSKTALRILDLSQARLEHWGEYDVLGDRILAATPSLEEVRLPKTLKRIGGSPFWGSGIKSFVLPKTVTDAGVDIFYQCDNLASISVEEGNPRYDSRENCNAIIETATNTLVQGCRSTVIPKSVVTIGKSAFSGVNALMSVDLPDGVTTIGSYAFWADKGLTKVTLSKSVVNLGEGPFVGCTNISSFVVDPENPVYDSRNNCNAIIETATNTLVQGFGCTTIPEDVVKIAPLAFMYQDFSSIEIPASIREIGASAFMYCPNLTSFVSHIKKPFPVGPRVFEGSYMESAVLYVPYGTKKAYSSTSGWGSFTRIIEMAPTEEEIGRQAATVEKIDFGKQYAGLNGQTLVPITLVGESIEPITSIDYTITTDGKVKEGHLEIDPISYMMTVEVLIPFDADGTTGEKTKKLTITKVNGKPNQATENSATGTLVTVRRKPKVVPLVEEATGTWCGWCPRGAVGLRLLNKTFRDDVVTVAVHSGDPMELQGYWLKSSGFPSCQINRGEFCDPYYGSGSETFGIKKEVEAVMRQYTIGEITVNAEWADDSQTAIKVNTTTTFVENVASSPYQIGFLLTEDKQTGTTSEWVQSNYFSNATNNDPNLKRLVESPAKITDMKYDHVAVGAWEYEKGIDGSLPATITSEKPMNFSYTLDISDNDHIQNKKNLAVVAILLNKETGAVVNAAKFKFTPDPDPSIVTVANYTRKYGDDNPEFEYTVEGGALEGQPEISCEATTKSPVGEYPIVIKNGTVDNEDVTYIGGTLTIEKAPLTVKAGNYEREQGKANPTFKLTYEGWKNGENESVLITKPTVKTTATKDSPVGEYEVTVSGGEAKNYVLTYENGILTVTVPAGMESIRGTSAYGARVDVYSTAGVLILKDATTLDGLRPGVYIVNGKKVVIK